MVGGAIESQADICEGLANPAVTGSPLNNITATLPAGVNFTTEASGVVEAQEEGSSSPRNLCRMGIATTLALLVGLFQVS